MSARTGTGVLALTAAVALLSGCTGAGATAPAPQPAPASATSASVAPTSAATTAPVPVPSVTGSRGARASTVAVAAPAPSTAATRARPASGPTPPPYLGAPWDPRLDFGVLLGARRQGGHVVLTFDRALLLSGDDFDEFAATEWHPNNDHVILNGYKHLRTFRLLPSAEVYGQQVLGPGKGTKTERITVQQLLQRLRTAPRGGVLVWLAHRGGDNGPVTSLWEQYRH